jgi:hypothetical protein
MPHYPGWLRLDQDVSLPRARRQTVMFEADPLPGAIVRVWVNGREAGAILWPPYRLDITRWAHTGRNHIRLAVCAGLGSLMAECRAPGIAAARITIT